jgi:hypothetical protein
MERTMKRVTCALVFAGACGLLVGAPHAQNREWTTSNGDAQRTSWVATDVRLTKDAVQKGELKFLWKMKLANDTRQLNSLTQPILLDRLISHRGFKSLAFVGASAERIYAVDSDLSRLYWETVINYSSITPPANSSPACPGGLVAAVTRPTAVTASAFGRGGGGRGGRSGSSVGEPGRGAPSLQQAAGAGRGTGDPAAAPGGRGAQPNPAAPTAAAGANAQGRGAARGGVGGLGGGPTENVYVLASDGFVRALNAHNGAERYPAVQFLPANAKATGVTFVDGLLYATTSNNCGAVPNGVYAIDLSSEEKKPIGWRTGGPSVAGNSGPAFGTDGTLYVAIADDRASSPGTSAGQGTEPSYPSSVVALDPKTLKLKDWFTAPGADFNASPVVVRHREKDLILASGNDGRLYVLDSASLGGSDHKSPLHVTAKYTGAGANAGVASWEDQNTRWVLAPVGGASAAGVKFVANGIRPNGSIVAFKLVEQDGKLRLEPAWASRDITAPLTPVIFNGVVFAVSSGEYRGQGDSKLTAAQRAQRSIPAVLYALDPATGKELWSSGKTITSFARAGLSAAAGQVYVVTFDNTLYAFGIPMEH